MKLEDIVNRIVILENLLTERDDWLSSMSLYEMKIKIIDKYLEPDSDSIEAASDIKDKLEKSRILLEGTESELFAFTGLSNIEECRNLLIYLKTILQTYMEEVGNSFISDKELNTKSKEELLQEATLLLERKS